MKFKNYLEEGFSQIKTILKVYKDLSRNVQPDNVDLWIALKDMKGYYEEYIKWDVKYNKDRSTGKLSLMHKKIHQEYKLRLKEINKALKTKSNMLVVLDTAINQLHYDFPVIEHIGMDVSDLEDPKAEKDYEELVDTLKLLLKRQGKILPTHGYALGSKPVSAVGK